jgi:hypothetical protein
MAKARRTSSGDPSAKQGVLISLGVCIPLIIILGVTTYFGFAGKSDAEAKATAANQEKDKAQKDATRQHNEAAFLRANIGLNLEKNDDSLPAAFHNAPEAANITKELDKEPGWDGVKQAPKETLKHRVDQLTADRDTAFKNRDTTINEKNKLKADLDAANKKYTDMEAKYRQDLDELNKKKEEDREKIAADLAKANQTINQLRDEMDDTRKKAELQRGEQSASIAKLNKEKKNLDNRLDVATRKIAAPYLPDYEQPKGKIDAIDRESRFAYINIGASENVKPLLTFSVYSPGPEGKVDLYKAEGTQAEVDKKRAAHEPVPKGTLEVVSILGPHSSKARITNVRDMNRDPIMRGDMIFNPIWSPNQNMHVAVTGLINLTGDGRDRSAEFIEGLKRAGVVIDSYLDTKDLKIKGPGITVNTNYLVEGEHPEVNNLLTLGGSTIGERSTKIDELINQMKKEAQDQGVSMMTARNFMTLVGYRIPKKITPFAGAGGYGTLGVGSSESKEGEAPKPKAKAKDKEMEDKDADKEKAAAPDKNPDADKEKAKAKDADKPKEGDKDAPKEDKPKEEKPKEGDKDAPKEKDK